ncbi:hypothetical protein TRFO_21445 [Tritrichomonas foetus]|uniref:Uncharacterized protein n=1 Tax=Tritrichomonas foetus TaxID=1144522 RepID=A0A1J4KF32_9EUKA|nr:hypothetical protein TRFO_21445 [Tritrichomonas foetus]|eukprot:OHT09634.1 hypothetical protein TRFO_21445 [Tritrichomonas foetus]
MESRFSSKNKDYNTIFKPKRKGTDLEYQKSPNNPSISLFSCAMILLNANFGTDPYFVGGGFINGFYYNLFALIICYIITIISFLVVVKCWIHGCTFSFRTIWEYCISKNHFCWIPELSIVLSIFYLTMFYYSDSYITLANIIVYFQDSDTLPDILQSRWIITYAVTSVLCLPAIFIKEIHQFLIISIISNIALVIPFFIMIYHFVHLYERFPDFSIESNIVYKASNPVDTLNFVLYIAAIVGNHPVIEYVVQVMNNPTYNRVKGTFFVSNIIGFLINLIVGLVSVFMFMPSSYYDNIYLMFDEDSYYRYDTLIITGKIFLYIRSVCTLVVMVWIGSRHLAQMFDSQWEYSNWPTYRWIPQTLATLCFILLNASGDYMNGTIITFSETIGMIGFMMNQFILPGLFYMRMNRKEMIFRDPWWYLSVFLLFFGVIITIASFFSQLLTKVGDG